MTVLQWISATLALLLALTITVVLRLGLWPASLPPVLLIGGASALLLLAAGWYLLASDGSPVAAPTSVGGDAVHALSKQKLPVPEISRRTGLPQDVVRSMLGQRSTRGYRAAAR